MKNKQTIVDDIITLRAFVLPENYPFLLEVYTKDGKDEAALIADIKQARETYKNLVSASKKPAVRTASYKPVAFEENQANP